MNHFAKILRENHMKVTPQRIAIYEVLSNTKEHPSAEMIYQKLSSIYSTMSLATVYKSLEAFKKADLLQELNVGEYSFRYDATTIPHPHIICTKCHCVEDLDDHLFGDLMDKVDSVTDYTVEKLQLYFYGICPRCK
ncbi:transcriptional repressor [Clostridiaceae bacterium 35-E11]